MSQTEGVNPLLDCDKTNHNPNIAFKLVARNQKTRLMWAHTSNESKYVLVSSVQRTNDNSIIIEISSKAENQTNVEKNEEHESALHFSFSELPKDLAKGYVLGNDVESCDVLLDDSGASVFEQMLTFTFNKRHQLVMNVKLDKPTSFKFKGQKLGQREQFSWIFPRHRGMIRVKMANLLEFDVILPEYGIHRKAFHENCEHFLKLASQAHLLADERSSLGRGAIEETSDTATSSDPFYLRGMRVGCGTYGEVYEALRMPDGKVFAAKRFKDKNSFQLEVKMHKKLCQARHDNIVKFVGEWHGDRKPTLIMEYVAGGNLCKRMKQGMEFGEIGNLANQMLLALRFCHNKDVMHWDIKPSNILCITQNQFVLGDFGVALEFGTHTKPRGTPAYMAPEAEQYKQHWFAADMWSLGVTLLECMDGLPDGDPVEDRQKWCRLLVAGFKEYYEKCMHLWHVYSGPIRELLRLVMDGLLVLNRDHRRPAWDCLESNRYPGLWEWSSQWKDSSRGAISDAATVPRPSIQAQSDWSFEANSLASSRFHDTEDMTFETVPGFKDDLPEDLDKETHSVSSTNESTKRKPESGSSSTSSKGKVEEKTIGPDLLTPKEETASVSENNENGKRKRESGSSSISSKGEVEEQTIGPDLSTPDHPENRTANSGPQQGGEDSSKTVGARSSKREPKRTRLGSE